MPSAVKKKSTRQLIERLIKKFKFEELEEAVMPVFPELSWKAIKSRLAKNHESFTTSRALRIIVTEMQQAKIDDKILKSRLGLLETVDVSRHYKRKTWYTYELRGTCTADGNSMEEIEERVREACETRLTPAEVHTVSHEDLIFLSLRDKPTKKQKKRSSSTSTPIYFCLAPDEQFCFCSAKNTPKAVVEALVEAMGYGKARSIKLTGRDVLALRRMMMNRKEALVDGTYNVRPEVKLKRAPPTITPLGLDFSQRKQRKLQAEKCFGNEPPSFEFLKVQFVDQPWHSDVAADKLQNETLSMGVEFRSPSVPNFLKHLTGQGILTFPLPIYASNLLTLGRNSIDIQPT